MYLSNKLIRSTLFVSAWIYRAHCCRVWKHRRICSSAARSRTPPSDPVQCSCSHPGRLKHLWKNRVLECQSYQFLLSHCRRRSMFRTSIIDAVIKLNGNGTTVYLVDKLWQSFLARHYKYKFTLLLLLFSKKLLFGVNALRLLFVYFLNAETAIHSSATTFTQKYNMALQRHLV